MRDFLIRVKNIFLSKKFIGFCLIGIVNTFNTAFFSWLAHLKIQENISAYIGYFISLTIKYSLQGTTQGNGLTGGAPPVRFSM